MARNPGLGRAADPYMDRWTVVHLLAGVLLAVLLPRFAALLLLVLWEPLVLLVLGPVFRRSELWATETQLAGPTLRNVLVDLVADVAGVLLGVFVVLPLAGMDGPLLFG